MFHSKNLMLNKMYIVNPMVIHKDILLFQHFWIFQDLKIEGGHFFGSILVQGIFFGLLIFVPVDNPISLNLEYSPPSHPTSSSPLSSVIKCLVYNFVSRYFLLVRSRVGRINYMVVEKCLRTKCLEFLFKYLTALTENVIIL